MTRELKKSVASTHCSLDTGLIQHDTHLADELKKNTALSLAVAESRMRASSSDERLLPSLSAFFDLTAARKEGRWVCLSE